MQPEAIIIYERVLKGERWPPQYIGTVTTVDRSRSILRYLFLEKLKIKDFDYAKKIVNWDFIRKHKLAAVIKNIEKEESRPVLLSTQAFDMRA